MPDEMIPIYLISALILVNLPDDYYQGWSYTICNTGYIVTLTELESQGERVQYWIAFPLVCLKQVS